MKVTRKVIFKTNDVIVGDQIKIKLDGFGKFTATAQKITNEGVLFMFDDCITKRQMNSECTNKGGYEASEMNRWLNEELIKAFPKKLQEKIKYISLPTYGQIFGHEGNFYEKFESDNNEQFTLMENRKNRIALFEDCTTWWWVQNSTKEEETSDCFACVFYGGVTSYANASDPCGVRPVILLAI